MKIEQINSIYTISKTNIFARENGCLEDYSFSKGTVYPDVTPTHSMSIFTCAVFNTPAQQHSTNHHPLDNDQTESPHCASVPNKILHSWRRPTKPVVARDTPPPPEVEHVRPWKLPKPNRKGSPSNHHFPKGELLNFGGVFDILAYYYVCWCLSQLSRVFGQIVMFHELWIVFSKSRRIWGNDSPTNPTFLGWGRTILCQIIWSNSPQMSTDHKTHPMGSSISINECVAIESFPVPNVFRLLITCWPGWGDRWNRNRTINS